MSFQHVGKGNGSAKIVFISKYICVLNPIPLKRNQKNCRILDLNHDTPPKFNSSPLKDGGWKTTFPLGR